MLARAAVLVWLAIVPGLVAGSSEAQTSTPQAPAKLKPEAKQPKPPPKPTPPAGSPQQPAPSKTSPAGPPAFGIAGFAEAGMLAFSASESFDAVYGGTSGPAWGGGVRITHRSGLFGQVSATTFSDVGERVFVDGSTVYPLGIETRLTITPIDFTGGWRFLPRPKKPAGKPTPPSKTKPAPPRPTPRLAQAPPPKPAPPPARPSPPGTSAPARRSWLGSLEPYVGGGIGIVRVSEEADFAIGADDVSESHTSYHALGGIEIPVSRWFGADVEAGLRWVPDGLAGNGVADQFGEQDLHHFFVMFRFRIGR